MRWDDPLAIWGAFSWDSPDYHLPANTPTRTRMATNTTPDDMDNLIALLEDMCDGLETHELTVGVKQNTRSTLLGVLNSLRTSETAYAVSKAQRAVKISALKVADEAAEAWLLKAAKVLRISLGERWTVAWEPTGFPSGSTAVPTSMDKRFTLLGSLKSYFAANPGKEAVNQGVTAAAAQTLHQSVSEARDALSQAETDQNSAKNARNTALTTARKRTRSCIDEINTLLGPNDPRWDAFGLNRPSDPDVALPASELTLTSIGPGSLQLRFTRGKRATRYRLFLKVLTVDADFQNVETIHDLSHTFTGLPTGKNVEVYVIAANEASEAPASPTVSATVE